MAPRRVLITGGAGNLGRKLMAALQETSWCEGVIALDAAAGTASSFVEWITADLRHPDPAWTGAFARADAVVHFAAQNPYPDASWADSASSFDITANVVDAAVTRGVKRFVFASSNHVMGGYKETEIATTPGALTTALPPLAGTIVHAGATVIDSTAYAAAKLMGERLLLARAGALGGVVVRIGWCQPGANRPDTLSAGGTPKADGDAAQSPRDLRWFQDMWLSNRDFAGVMLAALTADATHWPAPAIVVNGMSGNRDMPWDIAATRALIGYSPQDDVRAG